MNRVRVPSCRTEYEYEHEYEHEYEYDEYQEQDHAPTDPVGPVAHRDESSSTSVIVFDREPGQGACPFSLCAHCASVFPKPSRLAYADSQVGSTVGVWNTGAPRTRSVESGRQFGEPEPRGARHYCRE
jgi:hypothetical protein